MMDRIEMSGKEVKRLEVLRQVADGVVSQRQAGRSLGLSERQVQSVSNPWFLNFRVRQFSVTVRTVCSLAPCGRRTSISSVTVTSAPG